MQRLRQAISARIPQRHSDEPSTIHTILVEATKEASIQKSGSSSRGPVHWWNADVAVKRKDCLKARRLYSRSTGQERTLIYKTYKEARRALRTAIKDSKRASWDSLCLQIDENPWGQGYKMVRKKTRHAQAPLPPAEAREVIEKLFPRRPDPTPVPINPSANPAELQIPPVSDDEINFVIRKTKPRKAVGLDGVPGEAVLFLLRDHPDVFKGMCMHLFNSGTFPYEWRTSRLVLIPKGPTTPAAYRPISVISNLAKAVEHVINLRLNTFLEDHMILSPNQHGFRRGHHT